MQSSLSERLNLSEQYQAALDRYQAAFAALRPDEPSTAQAVKDAMAELEAAHRAYMNGGI